MGELHLEIIVDRMKREFNVEATVGKPQVAYRETIRKTCEEIEGKFVKQSGGRGQYGHVVLKIEPQEPGKGLNSLTRSKAVQFHVNTSLQLRRVLSKHCHLVYWLATQSSTLKSLCSSVLTMTLTPTKTPSVWLLRWRSKDGCRKASPSHSGTNDGS